MADPKLLEKIGQLLMFGFDGHTVPDSFADLIRTYHIGNVIFFSRNIASAEQCRTLTTTLQKLARDEGQNYPLIIAADQENGVVRRLPPEVPGLPGNMALGATQQPDNARATGALTANLLTHLGINMNLAPVLDVNNNPANPVIGVRSFGDVADAVADFGVAFASGLQSRGVIACGKHFPGHGDTEVDSHRDLPVIRHTRDRLDRMELVPFKAAIRAQIDAIMTAHVVFPAVEPDGIPATLSYRVLTKLLRQELGFTGLIITDCLEMNAISETVGVGRGAVEALKAGADMVMVSHRLDRQLAALHAIQEAVASGELSLSRIDEAYQRVTELKARRLTAPPPDPAAWPTLLAQSQNLQRQLAPDAVTWLRRPAGSFPPVDRLNTVAVLVDDRMPTMIAAGSEEPRPLLAQAMRRIAPHATVAEYHFPECRTPYPTEDLFIETLQQHDLLLMGINGLHADYLTLVNRLAERLPHSAIFLLRSPYDVTGLTGTQGAVLALYEDTAWMAEAALRALFGAPARGRLPVQVNERFPRGFRALD
ncbi:MAG: beta-N-acetylhexosaminidase [Firmicutes bacterium]|nr:beta-N-acetylhexosaminidase [Bacillota bacterium]